MCLTCVPMVSLKVSPTGFAFTRNPVQLVFENHGHATYRVSAGKEFFEGMVEGDAVVNLSELLEAMVPDLPVPWQGDGVFSVMGDASERLVSVSVSPGLDGEADWTSGFYAIKGGISLQNYRLFALEGTDAFQSRFLSGRGNFFLTARSHSWRIVMKETEVCPLAFISSGAAVEVRELIGGNTCSAAPGKNTLVWLDINALRKHFFLSAEVLANLFDISVAGKFACRIAVEAVPASLEHYRFWFRNSLGVVDAVDLPGTGKMLPSFSGGSDDDTTGFRQYDVLTDDFVKTRTRVRRGMNLEIEAILTGQTDIGLLCDMLASDEVWYLGEGLPPRRVIPVVDGLSFQSRITKPVNVTVRFSFPEEELNQTPDIGGVAGHIRPRVFSDEFSEQFN